MEVRAAVRANGGEVTIQALAEMPLVKSAVYEALRIEPPVAREREVGHGGGEPRLRVRGAGGELLFSLITASSAKKN